MNQDLHQIDDLFRSGLDGKEDSPTPQVWENIERELDKKDRKPVAGFFQNSGKAAAILFVLLGSAALFAAGYLWRDINLNRSNGKNIEHNKPSVIPESNSKNASLSPGSDLPTTQSKALPATEEVMSGPANSPSENQSEQPATDNENLNTGTSKIQAGSKPQSVTTGLAESNQKNSINKTGKSAKALTLAPIVNNGGNNKPGKQGKTNSSPGTRSVKNESYNSDLSINSEVGATSSSFVHEYAFALEPILTHPVPATEKRLDISGINSVKKQSSTKSDSPANIPVANKKAGNLNLHRLTITPIVALQTSSNKVNSDGSRWGNEMKKSIDESEHMPSRIGGGLLVDVKISRSLTLQSGFVLTQKDVHIDPKTVWAVKDIDGYVKYRLDCSAGTYYINPKQGSYPRPGDKAVTNYSSNSLNYMNIPLALKWHFGNEKLQIFATAGGSLNLLTSQSLEATVMHQYSYNGGRVSNLKNSFFNGMIGAGLNYNFSEKIGLNISPQYQFAITPMNENMPVTALPRTFNMQMGLQIKLK